MRAGTRTSSPAGKIKRILRGIWTLRKITQRIRQGFGQGELANYVPWVGVRDLSSKGTSTRMWSPKTGRKMEFLSNIERDTFLICEFREDFYDYWEQWPLERPWTRWAARRLGYRHPVYVGSTEDFVMSVDGIFSRSTGGSIVRAGIDCKDSKSSNDPRTKEKLRIAKLALEKQVGYPHMVVTEKTLNTQEVKNILWIRIALKKRNELVLIPGLFNIWPMRLHRHLWENQQVEPFRSMTVSAYCGTFQRANGLPPGYGLRCLKLLMWKHLVEFDMKSLKPAQLPLPALSVRAVQIPGAYLTPEVREVSESDEEESVDA